MKVVDINGVHEANSVRDLEEILKRRCENGVNSFWLSHGSDDYPTLAFLVKDDLATLNYLPEDQHVGLRSVGQVPNLQPGTMTRFSISANPGDDVFVLNEAVLPFSAALRAAKEFFISNSLPESVEWLQL